jgi:hypothetical protein
MSDSPLPPSPPPASPYASSGAPATAARQTNALALVSLISGILGWTLVPFLGSVVAIITGHMARAELRRNPDTQEGDGLAIAGLVMGWAMVAIVVLAVLLIVLLFGGIAAMLAGSGSY